ncbi:hypothetical protein [Streptomyces canus]|uniref:hypothetical protein n=1 Tax=Streptomyces canus TaxID=58343 RepID=UPI0018F8A717|nr:hypothetical protein [Streptomyces canus]
MDDRQNMDDGRRSLPFRRLSVTVAGATALVALSVGGAIAANSADEPTVEPSASATYPGDVGSGGSVGLSEGSDGGSDPGTSGGTDPSPSPTSPDDPPVTDDPTDGPSTPSELEQLNRRITELDRKIDELPTKRELADALRAFADELDKQSPPESPGETHQPTNEPQPTDSLPPH